MGAGTERNATRRGWRRLAARLAIVLLALTALAFGATRSVTLTPLLEATLSKTLGAEVRCAAARLAWNGDIVVRQLRVQARGEAGEAGRIFTARRGRIDVAWMGLLRGSRAAAKAVWLEEPTLRISVGEGGSVNLSSLARSGASGPSTLLLPPFVQLRRARVEFGEHDAAGAFTELARLVADGSLTRQPGRQAVYDLRLDETPENAQPQRELLHVAGTLDLAHLEGELRLEQLNLDRWGVKAAPHAARSLLSQLRIKGRVRQGRFRYSAQEGLAAELELAGVGVELPVPVETDDFVTSEPVATRMLRADDVTGLIHIDSAGLRASLVGVVEDLPGAVELTTKGLSLNSALRCTVHVQEYAMGQGPGLLPFAPRHVRRTFENFSYPKGLVSGEIVFERAEPVHGRAAPVLARGRLHIRQGWAMRSSFPYPISDIEGDIEFDNEKVVLKRLRGVGPSGAPVEANGVISPLGRWAGVDVTVHAADAPLDDALLGALRPASQRAARSLLDEEAFRQLTREGALDGLDFTLGGRGDITVRVRRAAGEGAHYSTRVEARFPTVGLLPRAFPHPLIAEDLTLTVEGGVVHASSAAVRTPVGGVGSLVATARLRRDKETPALAPDVRLTMRSAPITELLVRALPPAGVAAVEDDGAATANAAGSWSAATLVRKLGLQGQLDVDLHVTTRPDGATGYDATIALQGLRAAPSDDAAPLVGLQGVMQLSEDGLLLKGAHGALGNAAVEADVRAAFAGRGRRARSLQARIRVKGLALRAPLAGWARLASPTAAATVDALQRQQGLGGVADATVVLTQQAQEPVQATVRVENLQQATVQLFDVALEAPSLTGAVIVDNHGARFDGLAGKVFLEGEPLGDVLLDGAAPKIDANGVHFAAPLSVSIVDGVLTSSLLAATLGRADEQARRTAAQFGAEGAFDAALLFSDAGTSGDVDVHLSAISQRGVRVALEEGHGRLIVAPGVVQLRDLELATQLWRARLSAVWDRRAGDVEGELELQGAKADESLLALAPSPVRQAVQAVQLSLEGPFRLERGVFAAPLADPSKTRFDGSLHVEGASARLGASLRDIAGTATVAVHPDDPASPVRVELTIDRTQVAGLSVRQGRGSVVRAADDGMLVAEAVAELHHGRVALEGRLYKPAARLWNSEDDAGGGVYELNLRLQDVDFASVLSEWSGSADEAAPGERGKLRGSLFVAGELGRPESRYGRGEVEVRGGEILTLPLLMPILELSNLSPPQGEPLSDAKAEFFIQGSTLRFERLEARSRSLLVVGEGKATLPSLTLDLRFGTQRRRRLGLLSDLLEGIRDEIATVTVTGTLASPVVGVEQLPATRKLLNELFRTARSDDQEGQP